MKPPTATRTTTRWRVEVDAISLATNIRDFDDALGTAAIYHDINPNAVITIRPI